MKSSIHRTKDSNANALLSLGEYWFISNIGKTKYMEIGLHRDMMANLHTTVGIIHMKPWKPLNIYKYLGFFLSNRNFIQE